MWKRKALAMLLLGSLAGCAGGGGGTGNVPVATGTTFEQQLVSAAGLGDFSQVPAEQMSRDGANASTAALTGLTAINPVGGMTSFSSLGMGALMFLASPPKSAASFTQMIAVAPLDQSTDEVALALQNKLTAEFSHSVEAAGYKPTMTSFNMGQKIWLREGCDAFASMRARDENCVQSYTIYLEPKGSVGSKRTFLASDDGTSMFKSIRMIPPRKGAQGDVVSSRNALSKAPGMLFLYVAPIETAEGWSEPFVVGPSGAKPLVR